MSSDSYVGAVPVRGQLSRLDRLVAAHETYWPAVAQQNPQSPVMRDFLRRHWDPWFSRWMETRSRLDRRQTSVDATGSLSSQLVPASDETVASFVRESAGGLSSIRQIAADNRIPMPDLGTSRHGILPAEEPRVTSAAETYNKVTEDTARGNLTAREGERDMSAYTGNYIGADGQSYPEIAARAVRSVHAQHRSPFYGYIRSGINQKIYLFPRLDDASAWFSQHVQLQPDHDYAAVFSAANLRAPVAGMEHFQRTTVGCAPHVGSWWPFLLGLPLGGVGGYFLRRWQEQNPGLALPFVPPGQLPAPKIPPEAMALAPTTSGDPYVGGPWLDLVGQDYGYSDGVSDGYAVGGPWVDVVGQDYDYGYGDPSVGGPWLDIVGAQADDARRREWPQTKALIQSAISDVTSYDAIYPAAAYVWTLDAPASSPYAGRSPSSVVILEGTTNIVPFSSQGEALKYLREVAQTRPVALAMFERSSEHWPNPVAWRKSDQPDHESVIAQHVASKTPTQASGEYIGADTVIGAAIDDVRRRAQTLANKRAGNVIGVIHTSKDGLWHTLAFRSADDADDWLNTATQDQNAYTYAAYFDKDGDSWPSPYIEKIGGIREPRRTAAAGQWWAA